MSVPVPTSRRARKRYVLETCWPHYEVNDAYVIVGMGAYKITKLEYGRVRLKRTHYVWPPINPVKLIIEFREEEWRNHLRSGYARRYYRKVYGWWNQGSN